MVVVATRSAAAFRTVTRAAEKLDGDASAVNAQRVFDEVRSLDVLSLSMRVAYWPDASAREGDGDALGEGDWCSLPVATEASSFRVLAPATVLVKELWPLDGWRTPRFRDVGWASWKGGRVGGQGLVEQRPVIRRALTTQN